MSTCYVESIVYKEESGLKFYFNEAGKEKVGLTEIETIQTTIIMAFICNAKIELEFYTSSDVIKRVKPFNFSQCVSRNLKADYYVSRIGTQKDATQGEKLEVFLIKRGINEVEVSYDAFNPGLQKLLVMAFVYGSVDKFHLYATLEKPMIKNATLGKKVD